MSEYKPQDLEKKWQKIWKESHAFQTSDDISSPKYYVLDMFPYPSGAGLHVGHPLGYIATDIVSRYKRLKGFNVLHPMGFDSFGLPAEQYAIQTGQHPAITTENNIARYKEQLDNLGFSFDWSKEVRTSDSSYYRWTQWIFIQLFNSWYSKKSNKAESIDSLFEIFSKEGNQNYVGYKGVAVCDENTPVFTAEEWIGYSAERKHELSLHYRLAFRSNTFVNWCAGLGTVLANEEVKDGVSERGGFLVERKEMAQWSLRITAYAERLIQDLDLVDWPEPIKDQQKYWIGKSKGCMLDFKIQNSDSIISVFTTRVDTIFGVTYLTLAPEHDLVEKITTEGQKEKVAQYVHYAKNKSERDRQADVKTVTGEFTGAYATNPLNGKLIPIWIGEYVLAGYGTGAVMAVPSSDTRDYAFATHFNLAIIPVQEGAKTDITKEDFDPKAGTMINSEFLNGMNVSQAIETMTAKVEELGIGYGKLNYKIRDSIFSRQRYWGEPIPIYYKNGLPYAVEESELPLELPKIDEYKPTDKGEPPLARAEKWDTSRLLENSSPPLGEGLGVGSINRSQPSNTITSPGVGSANRSQPSNTTTSLGGRAINRSDFRNATMPQKINSNEDSVPFDTEHSWQTTDPSKWRILKENARNLRKNQTEAEKILWNALRDEQVGVRFRRQQVIDAFIVDFVNIELKLVIEVDGGIHLDKEVKEYDQYRTLLLENLGYYVLRFTNEQVENEYELVIDKIKLKISELTAVKRQNIRFSSLSEDSFQLNTPPLTPPQGEGNTSHFPLETSTMPGWAGSSWYFLRYMDPTNSEEFASKKALEYWQNVDLYLGGSEHATGHLLYSRFWQHFLFDLDLVPTKEYAKKLINQGMIQGRSNFVYRITGTNQFVSYHLKDKFETTAIYVDVNIVENDLLDLEKFKSWREEYANAEFITEDGKYLCGYEVEKMSKSKYNVVNPDDVIAKYGADCLRMYEMFLGPLELSKPWSTSSISGVSRFLRNVWRLFFDDKGTWLVKNEPPTQAELKVLHKAVKKVEEDIERFSFNTSVSTFMVCVNELYDLKCHKMDILHDLLIILSPYAPHITEELYLEMSQKFENINSDNFILSKGNGIDLWPDFNEKYLVESSFEYPISINGKMRHKMIFALDKDLKEIEKEVIASTEIEKWLEGKSPKKIIVVPNKIVNVVV